MKNVFWILLKGCVRITLEYFFISCETPAVLENKENTWQLTCSVEISYCCLFGKTKFYCSEAFM